MYLIRGGGGEIGLCNFFFARDHFCRLVITFVNSLDPHQDRQKVGPDLGPNHLILQLCS